MASARTAARCGSWVRARGWLSVGQVGADVANAGDVTNGFLDLGRSLARFDVAVQDRDSVLDSHVDAGVVYLLFQRADGGPDAVGEDRVVQRGAGVPPHRSIGQALGLVDGAMQVYGLAFLVRDFERVAIQPPMAAAAAPVAHALLRIRAGRGLLMARATRPRGLPSADIDVTRRADTC